MFLFLKQRAFLSVFWGICMHQGVSLCYKSPFANTLQHWGFPHFAVVLNPVQIRFVLTGVLHQP